MAKNVPQVNPTAPHFDEATPASLNVISAAEGLSNALQHSQRAGELSERLARLGKELDKARVEIRDWKFHTDAYTRAVRGELGAAIALWYAEIGHALDNDFLAIGDVINDRLSPEANPHRADF